MVVQAIEVVRAYEKIRQSAGPGCAKYYPVELLAEWDDVRCKVNPNAKLSSPQKILCDIICKSRSSQDQVKISQDEHEKVKMN